MWWNMVGYGFVHCAKGNNYKVGKPELHFMFSASYLMMLHTDVKMEGTQKQKHRIMKCWKTDRWTDKRTDTKNFRGYDIILCHVCVCVWGGGGGGGMHDQFWSWQGIKMFSYGRFYASPPPPHPTTKKWLSIMLYPLKFWMSVGLSVSSSKLHVWYLLRYFLKIHTNVKRHETMCRTHEL